MKLETKQELEQLLHDAIVHLKINNAEFVEPISVDTYIENLKILREYYFPDLKTKMSYYSLEIYNKEIELKLLNFMKVQFKDYINIKHRAIRIASDSIGSGGDQSGESVEILLTKLIEIAISTTLQKAIDAFEKSVTETKGSFKRVILLQGPTTHPKDRSEVTEIDISEGIRLVRLPRRPQNMPPYLFPGGFSG